VPSERQQEITCILMLHLLLIEMGDFNDFKPFNTSFVVHKCCNYFDNFVSFDKTWYWNKFP